MIKGTLTATHTAEELEERLNAIEANGLDDKVVRLTDFGAGRLPDNTAANEAQFDEVTERPAGKIVIATGVPMEADAKGGFFSKLQKRGLELIAYSNIFVRGDDGNATEIEAVTCREDGSQDAPASPEEHPVAETAPAPSASAAPAAPASTAATTTPSPALPPASAPVHSTDISDKALNLIFESEGLDQPSAWPGGASGITIGVGYDLGYAAESDFVADWSSRLGSDVIDRLKHAIGKKGGSAHAIASSFKGLKIERGPAREVFRQRDLPRFRKQARDAFGSNFDKLPTDAQGALISLVFNRGAGMKGDSRKEMRDIREAINSFQDGHDLQRLLDSIADALIAMKRIWRGKGLDGLLVRRDAEATLTRNALS